MLSSDDHHQLFTVFDYDLAYRYNVLGVEPVVIDKARQMANRQPLRAYDAVHLATAWLLNEELLRADKSRLTFVYADERLIAIAQAEVCSPTIPAITPDLASVSPPPKKTVDYVDSVCVAIYGLKLMAMMFGVTRPPTRIAAVEKL